MKRLLLLLLFISTAASAQIINFPDPVLKAKLLEANPTNNIAMNTPATNQVALTIDANGDGEIEVSETANVRQLNLSNSQITSLDGIGAFSNLQSLVCRNNQLTTIDVSMLPDLSDLSCGENNLTAITVGEMSILNSLYCSNNLLTALPTEHLGNLMTLYCNNNQITALNLHDMPILHYLECQENQLTSLDASNHQHLTEIRCFRNQIAEYNFSNCSNLYYLYCWQNPATSLDVSGLTILSEVSASGSLLPPSQMTSFNAAGCTNLHIASLSGNALTSVDVSGCGELTILNVDHNNLTSVDISDCHDLVFLFCRYNQISSLDLSDKPEMVNVACDFNPITTLDITECPKMLIVEANDTPIVSIYAKNGTAENLNFVNTPQLAYICVDEEQIENVQWQIAPDANILVSTYCSFTPGGSYNTISGNITFDADGDGCDDADSAAMMVNLSITDGTITGNEFSGNNGTFTFYAGEGNHTITPMLENPGYFSVDPPSATVHFDNADNNTETINFCVSAVGVHNDLEIVIVPDGAARPGFDANYMLIYKNKGNQIASGNIVLDYNDDSLDFVSAAPAATSNSGGHLSFDYGNLSPSEQRSIYITLNLNSPVETPPLNLGDILSFTGTINPVSGDESPNDNVFALRQMVVNSVDPNDKHCLEGDSADVSQIGNYLHYQINFENTGTAAAQNVVVKDVLDSEKFDLTSLQVQSASHAVQVRRNDNKVEFIFEGINLGEGEHGNVVFKIKTKNTLQTNDSVTNKAEIFFDYNFPVETDTATTTFELLATQAFAVDDSIRLYPNPTAHFVDVQANATIRSIQVFDMEGRILATHLADRPEARIDLSRHASGIYYLKVRTDRGTATQKIIKK
jgi:uncharacterized repeat protein (TIGR01451 family)